MFADPSVPGSAGTRDALAVRATIPHACQRPNRPRRRCKPRSAPPTHPARHRHDAHGQDLGASGPVQDSGAHGGGHAERAAARGASRGCGGHVRRDTAREMSTRIRRDPGAAGIMNKPIRRSRHVAIPWNDGGALRRAESEWWWAWLLSAAQSEPSRCSLEEWTPRPIRRGRPPPAASAIAQSAKCRKTLTAVRDSAVRDHPLSRPITSIRLAAFVNMSCSATAGSKGEH